MCLSILKKRYIYFLFDYPLLMTVSISLFAHSIRLLFFALAAILSW